MAKPDDIPDELRRRLASAASDLLAALEEAEYALGNTVKPESWRDFDDLKVWAEHWLPVARAALAKARGEHQ